MQVEVRFICPELAGPLRSGIYEVPENATISELLETGSSDCSGGITENAQAYMLFLLNGRSAQPDARLSPGDKLYVLRKVFGG